MTRGVRRRGWCVAAALGALLVAAAAESGQETPGRRLALVVGNDAYTDQVVLRNAVNDARAVTAALRDVGFAVETVENVTRARFAESLGDFARGLRPDDVALFYFAGHGLQVDGVNYLIPTDYAGQSAADLRLSALRATDVEDLLSRARVAMLMLDACRNNPYGGGTRGGDGLAPMTPRGTLIAYAAGAGEFASDAAPGAANGLFTSEFVEALKVPGLEAYALFQRVRRRVTAASNQEQRPAVYSDLDYPFVFRPAPPAATEVGGAGDESVVLRRQDTVFWESIRDSRNPSDFEAYLETFPNGTFSALAGNRLAALRRSAGAPPSVEPLRDPPARDRPRPLEPRTVFRDCDECPEMVVQPGGVLALGRHEVTVGEYLAFASATGAGERDCSGGGSWRDPGFPQTDRHPVTCVSWYDAVGYASWLSRTTGATYRLPTSAEWERAAAGSRPGCYEHATGRRGTCPVGSTGANPAGLSDMVGNLYEWTADCVAGDCGRRMLRGGSWQDYAAILRPGARSPYRAGFRVALVGFRVARTLE